MSARAAVFRAVILGAPASGKGTIAARIVRDFGLKHVSSGDLLRAQISRETDLGKSVKKFITKGQLVPDDIIAKLITEEIGQLSTDAWLLDGFPRTRVQAELLHSRQPLDVVISLEVPEDEIINRVTGRWTHLPSGRIYHTEFNPPQKHGIDDVTGEPLIQREDDHIDTVKQRLKVYRSNVHPVLEFYKQRGVLQQFHGRQSNEIWPRVQRYLSSLLPPLNAVPSS